MLSHLIGQVQGVIQSLIAIIQANEVIINALRLHFQGGVLTRQLVKLALQGVDLQSESRDSLVSVLFDLLDSDDLPLESLRLLEESLVHLLDLVTLHLVLLLQG